jgi:outer membrane protein assembly factor BamB
VTDGRRVYAYFGSAGLVCCNHDGDVLWVNKELPHDTAYGAASSPILCDDRIIIASESRPGVSEGYGYIAAVDCGTGRILFKRQRSEAIAGRNGVHRTPLLRDIGGKKAILVWGWRDLAAYDSVSGDELWHRGIEDLGSGDAPVVSLVADEKRLYLAGTRKTVALAVDRLGTDQDPTLWERKVAGPDCSTPVLANGLLLMVSDVGKATCLDAQSGNVLWQARLKGTYYPSPVIVGNRVYFCNNKGCTTVATYDRAFEAVGENDLGETTYASLAPVDGMLLARTVGHVYCIKEKGTRR